MAADPLVAFAAEVGERGAVTCAGGRTAWEVGGLVDEGASVVRAPVGLVEHEPAEMTVRVRAGTPVAELQAELATKRQRVLLPDPGPGATVGGVLAVGRSDVRRLAYGPVRDVVLEVRTVSSRGTLVKAGGPTVKNVSGFDLCRVIVGSLGTIGLLGEVILRTRPVPETSAWWAAIERDVDPFRLVRDLYRPAAVLWDGRSTWVLLEGRHVDVRAEAARLARRGFVEADGPPARPPHPSAGPPESLRSLSEPVGSFLAEVGVGTVHTPSPLAGAEPATAVVELNRRVKQQLDPTGRLNPGRDPLQAVVQRPSARVGEPA